jgi:predicted kinase
MKKAILTVGISASGKSTWAAEHIYNNPNTVEINRDNIRAAVHYHKTKTEFSWTTWNRKWEKEVTEIQTFYENQYLEINKAITYIRFKIK